MREKTSTRNDDRRPSFLDQVSHTSFSYEKLGSFVRGRRVRIWVTRVEAKVISVSNFVGLVRNVNKASSVKAKATKPNQVCPRRTPCLQSQGLRCPRLRPKIGFKAKD